MLTGTFKLRSDSWNLHSKSHGKAPVLGCLLSDSMLNAYIHFSQPCVSCERTRRLTRKDTSGRLLQNYCEIGILQVDVFSSWRLIKRAVRFVELQIKAIFFKKMVLICLIPTCPLSKTA